MTTDLNQAVQVSLPKSVCLVLYELLAASTEEWSKSGAQNESNNSSGVPLTVTVKHFEERAALLRLEGTLESALPELFSPNYWEIVAEARRLLSDES